MLDAEFLLTLQVNYLYLVNEQWTGRYDAVFIDDAWASQKKRGKHHESEVLIRIGSDDLCCSALVGFLQIVTLQMKERRTDETMGNVLVDDQDQHTRLNAAKIWSILSARSSADWSRYRSIDGTESSLLRIAETVLQPRNGSGQSIERTPVGNLTNPT